MCNMHGNIPLYCFLAAQLHASRVASDPSECMTFTWAASLC